MLALQPNNCITVQQIIDELQIKMYMISLIYGGTVGLFAVSHEVYFIP